MRNEESATTKSNQKKMTPREMIRKKSQERDKKKYSPSYSDMKRLLVEAEQRFVKASPQPLLGGKSGVTLIQMADSLEIPHAEMRRKFDKSEVKRYLSHCNYDVMEFSITSRDNKEIRSYVLSVEAAKHVASSANSIKGFLYRDFLIRSTEALKVTVDHSKELAEEIIQLKEENEKLRKLVGKSSRKEAVRELTISQSEEKSHLFGEVEVAKTVKKTFDEMSPAERNLYDLQQGIKRSLGIMKKCRERIDLDSAL